MLYPKPKYKRHKRRAKRSKQAQLDTVKRDGRCMWCGRGGDTLVGHHISSFGASGSDDPMNMITLCGRCHTTVGQGYLLVRVCNHPKILESLPGLHGVAGRTDTGDPKVWEVDKVLQGILEEAYEDNLA